MAFSLWSNSSDKSKEQVGDMDHKETQSKTETADTSVGTPAQDEVRNSSGSTQGGVASDPPGLTDLTEKGTESTVPAPASALASTDGVAPALASEPEIGYRVEKRFSWRSLTRPRAAQGRKASLPLRKEVVKEATARQEYVQHQVHRSRSERHARDSALIVRELIVGSFATPSAAPPKKTKVLVSGSTSAEKVKAQLLQPKTARKVIAQLRQLPSSDTPVVRRSSTGEEFRYFASGPIHAVCLPCPDAEANERHFAQLDKVEAFAPFPKASPKVKERSMQDSTQVVVDGIASITATSFDKLKAMLSNLDVVSLITVPDWGLGQPADAPGLLSGAVPTAKAILEGVEQVTPQLMALGYATSKAILPSHAGVYPPTDRMSLLTYWWGFEVVMPEPSVQYLSNVPSVAHTVINFLIALSVASGGVREILPFVRYISTYIDAEYSTIRDQDQGQGVACAATWLMPAALVPRTWDFPQAPPQNSPQSDGEKDGSVPLPAAPAARANLLPVPNDDVPEVTVTPPTPTASETLGKPAANEIAVSGTDVMANGANVATPEGAASKVGENDIATAGKASEGKGVVNGLPAVSSLA